MRDIPRERLPWLSQRIGGAFAAHNIWELEYSDLYPVLRVQRYKRGDYIGRHIDYGYEWDEHTKLTAVAMLGPRHCWTGGELIVGNQTEPVELDRGDCVVFPGFAVHEVTRVKSGERITLAAWAMGRPAR